MMELKRTHINGHSRRGGSSHPPRPPGSPSTGGACAPPPRTCSEDIDSVRRLRRLDPVLHRSQRRLRLQVLVVEERGPAREPGVLVADSPGAEARAALL